MTSRPLRRLSLNQKTTNSWSLPQAIDGCVRHGLEAIGVWREPLADLGVDKARRLLDDAGLRVSSLCRGGFVTALDPEARRAAFDENRRAIEEAAALHAACLVVVVGGLPEGSKDLPGARERAAEAISQLAPLAADHGVRLALEPMHPIYTADRGVLATLGEALDLAERFPSEQVGVVVDSFHVWWDPQLEQHVARAGDRIASFQICDWITPLPPDALLARVTSSSGAIWTWSPARAMRVTSRSRSSTATCGRRTPTRSCRP
jgi:sugar phosphate isomerase/epimerase